LNFSTMSNREVSRDRDGTRLAQIHRADERCASHQAAPA